MSTIFTGSANTKVLATATLFTIGLVVYFVLIPKCNFVLLERFSRRASIFITFFIVVKFFCTKRFYLCFLVFFLCLLPTGIITFTPSGTLSISSRLKYPASLTTFAGALSKVSFDCSTCDAN